MVRSPSYLNGVLWSGINACSAVLMPMAVFIFFARTATPDMIGTVVVAVSCIEMLKTLALPGLYEAVLQQTENQRQCHETVSFILLAAAIALLAAWLLGLAIFSLFVASVASHFIAFAALGSRVLFDLAALQPQAHLAQRLAYRRLGLRTTASISLGGTIGIALALLIDPFIGLIAYQIAQSATFLLSTIIGTQAAVWPRLHMEYFRRMRREATLATGVRLVAASMNNVDQIIAAMLLGSTSLAFYNLGKRIETTFVTAAGSFSTILFQPQFAKRRSSPSEDDPLLAGICILTCALGLPVAVFIPNSSLVVPGVFGPQWTGASTVAAVMAIAGFVRAVGFVPGALMSVTVRNRQLFALSLTSVFGAALLMVLAAPFGILRCAIALLAMHLAILACMMSLAGGGTARPIRDRAADLVVPFLLMVLGAQAGRSLVENAITTSGVPHEFLNIGGSMIVGALVAAGYFALRFRRRLAVELVHWRGGLEPRS
jgi:O-antigen/teichoic acid export membrane protein